MRLKRGSAEVTSWWCRGGEQHTAASWLRASPSTRSAAPARPRRRRRTATARRLPELVDGLRGLSRRGLRPRGWWRGRVAVVEELRELQRNRVARQTARRRRDGGGGRCRAAAAAAVRGAVDRGAVAHQHVAADGALRARGLQPPVPPATLHSARWAHSVPPIAGQRRGELPFQLPPAPAAARAVTAGDAAARRGEGV